MTRRPSRALALLLAVGLTFAGACSDDDDDGGSNGDGASATTTTTASGDDETTTTTSGGSTTTTSSSSSDATAPPASGDEPGDGVIELTIVGGNVVGGVRRETVKQGAQVTLRVTSDVADELHVHTYDKKTDLVPGQSADLTFLANVPGVFEVELEERHKKVLELEVRP